MSADLVVTMKDVRAARLCAGGTRRWFQHYGLDHNDFLTNGIPAAKLEAIGDPLGLRAVAAAKDRVHG